MADYAPHYTETIAYRSVMRFSWSWCQFHLSVRRISVHYSQLWLLHYIVKFCDFSTGNFCLNTFRNTWTNSTLVWTSSFSWSMMGQHTQKHTCILLWSRVHFSTCWTLEPLSEEKRGSNAWSFLLYRLILHNNQAFIHLSLGLVLLVFFGPATWSFGSDMASSISKEGTAHIPLWLLWDTKGNSQVSACRLLWSTRYYTKWFNHQIRNVAVNGHLFGFSLTRAQHPSALTSSLDLTLVFCRPLTPEGAMTWVVTYLWEAAAMFSSSCCTRFSSSALISTSDSLSSNSDSAPPSSSSSS